MQAKTEGKTMKQTLKLNIYLDDIVVHNSDIYKVANITLF